MIEFVSCVWEIAERVILAEYRMLKCFTFSKMLIAEYAIHVQ